MKIIVLGRGYLGKEFERHGYEVWGRDKFTYNINKESVDAFEFSSELYNCDIIINCIAKSNTRWCEANFDEALAVNGILPKKLSNFCDISRKKFVHISTGCLYDNAYKINKETDFTAAHCNYTVTKWVGEQGCNKEKDLILRPRLLFDSTPCKNNFLYRLLNFNSCVINRQDSLTCTTTLVESIIALLKNKQTGIFNVANKGNASMWQIAKWLDSKKEILDTSIEQVREDQGLYLVNNTMDLTKLKKFYNPKSLEICIKECYNNLK